MSLLVAGLVAIAMTLLVTDHAVAAGIMLALSGMKPQFVFLLLPLARHVGCSRLATPL